MTRLLLITLSLILTACSGQSQSAGAGGVSAGEAQALDDAAEMIEAKRLPKSALRPPAAETAPTNAPTAK